MKSNDVQWSYEADVIIIGFGGAGACAAVEIHDAGSSSIILEKQPEATHYSNTRMSGGGYHSPDPTGDREALKSYAKAMFSGDNLPWKFEGEQTDYSDGLAAVWADFAPQNAAFMCGLDPGYHAFPRGEAAFPDFPGAKESKYRSCNSGYDIESFSRKPVDSPKTPKEKKEAGEAFHQCLLHGLNERKVPIHYETRAMMLIQDDSGAVIGVKAERDGQELYYRAKRAVILASGGFEYNKALRSAFLDGPGIDGWAFYGTPANTGDGIIMGIESGAALAKVGSAAGRLIGSFPSLRAGGIRIGIDITSVARGIVVDNFGQRFCNEWDIVRDPTRYISYRLALSFDIHRNLHPRIPSWFVFDETLRMMKSITNVTISDYLGVPWSQDNHEAIDNGWILKANTIEELGEKIINHEDNHGHMVIPDLCRTVKEFNEFCTQGEDRNFHRDAETLVPVITPPFYALPLFPGGPNTKGGLKTNDKRQVLDWAGEKIPRLYAAGEIASAFKFVYSGGGNVAECIVYGRWAGINAVKETPLE